MIIDELFVVLGIKGDGSLKKAETQLDKIKKLAGQIGVAFGAGILFRGMQRFIEEQRALGDELDKTSKAIGTSVEDLQSIHFASSIAGIGTATLNSGLKALQKQARDAALGSQTAIMAFSRLGMSVRDSSGQFKPATQLYREAIGGLAKLKNSTEKSAIAQQLFGESGTGIIVAAKGGVKGFRELEKEAARLGGGFRGKATQAAADFTDTLARLELANTSLRGVLAEQILPVLDKFVKGSIETSIAFREWIKDTNILKAAMIVLGGVMLKFLIPFAPAIAAALVFAGIIAGVVLVIDDLITALDGGESGLGRFLITLQASFAPLRMMTSLLEDLGNMFGTLEEPFKSPTIQALMDTARSILTGQALSIAAGQASVESLVPERNNVSNTAQIQNTIVVEGAGDPGAVANAVAEKIQEQNAKDNAAAFAELVPAVAQ